MIRRWSRVNLTNNKNLPELFFLKYLFRSFKKSTIYKKLLLTPTKYNRHSFGLIKHKYAGLLLQQVFNFWVLDIIKIKKLNKVFYIHYFSLPFFIIDPFHFSTKKNKTSPTPLAYVSSFISKKYFKRLTHTHTQQSNLNLYWKYLNFAYLNSAVDESLILNNLFFFTIDSLSYPVKFLNTPFLTNQENLSIICDKFSSVTVFQIVEYYKLLILLWITMLYSY